MGISSPEFEMRWGMAQKASKDIAEKMVLKGIAKGEDMFWLKDYFVAEMYDFAIELIKKEKE